MNNYLNESTNYGGTVEQTGGEYGRNYGYWTINSNLSGSTHAWGAFLWTDA